MAKRSVEDIKKESHWLRGDIPETLADPAQDHFDNDGLQLLKFHGIYQQDDRDARKARRAEGLDKLYFFMVRSKLPGGRLTAEQWLAHDEMCDTYGRGDFRLTSRQGIQLHGVVKGDLQGYVRGLNEHLVSTLAACGDVSRNVMCNPEPKKGDRVHDQMQALASAISERMCPQTPAYHEIWLNGERTITHTNGEVVEPVYGPNYLPRKFKISVSLPEDNSVDALSNDVAFLALHENGAVTGYDVWVGGGQGNTLNAEKTYPRIATPLCFVTPHEAIEVLTAIVGVQRDHGNREDRKVARMKYTIDRMGQDAFRAKVAEYHGEALKPHSGTPVTALGNPLGWHEQGDGKWWRGVHVLSGRIRDEGESRIRTGLKEVIREFKPEVRITAIQDVLLCDIEEKDKDAIDRILREHGVEPKKELPIMRQRAMSCVATPTCGLAVADSERVFDELLDAIHAVMAEVGIGDADLAVHMTGCPNGCARPYSSDVGLVGRAPGKYMLFLGGNTLGTALNFTVADRVPLDDIAATLRPAFESYRDGRNDGEGFGDYCRRRGEDAMTALVG